MLETTREKVAKLFKPETQKRLEDEGLMVVDKQDFQIVLDGYNEWMRMKRGVRDRERHTGQSSR